ncbi:MAG: twin-arginine translocation signal domain-containing protein, partial [Candidatus Aminicenantes bacterium]|nr:twin-arginine translocation signal domain-containing protein [Candidatus Aminicenantes bacterium]
MKIPKKNPLPKGLKISRREFLGTSATAAAGLMIVPRHVLGGPGYTAPSDKLDIGCVGVGGKGTSDIWSVSSENVIALCDVDDTQMATFLTHERNDPQHQPMYNKANKYR